MLTCYPYKLNEQFQLLTFDKLHNNVIFKQIRNYNDHTFITYNIDYT